MILIFSEQDDYWTNNIIDWLAYYNEPYKRLNENDSFFEITKPIRINLRNKNKLKSIYIRTPHFFTTIQIMR